MPINKCLFRTDFLIYTTILVFNIYLNAQSEKKRSHGTVVESHLLKHHILLVIGIMNYLFLFTTKCI